MATNVEKKDDGAKKSSGLRSTRKLFARWTGLRHAVKRTTKALVGPREPAREPPRILIDSTYAKRTFKKAELEKLFEKRKKRVYDLAPAPADLEKAVPDDVEAVGEDATVVIDAGSFLTRIGLTGEGEPRMVAASPKATIQRMVEIVIDELGAEECHVGVAPCSLYGQGYTTGLVLDVGAQSARALPVIDGFATPHALCVDAELSGDRLNADAADFLRARAAPSRPQAPRRALFNPKKVDKQAKTKGLAALIKQSIYKSEEDMRVTLWGGVLLVGGGSSLNGTPERLEEDLFIISPDTIDVAVTASPGRDVMAWQGGAYLTTLPEFENNWIHVEDREDPALRSASRTRSTTVRSPPRRWPRYSAQLWDAVDAA
ncbi:hypothetical protein JL720_14363 [Aureococcus anophagefferens]|nr:hypothetical protein JL720_14363 [Aureococcus anophagefferens]